MPIWKQILVQEIDTINKNYFLIKSAKGWLEKYFLSEICKTAKRQRHSTKNNVHASSDTRQIWPIPNYIHHKITNPVSHAFARMHQPVQWCTQPHWAPPSPVFLPFSQRRAYDPPCSRWTRSVFQARARHTSRAHHPSAAGSRNWGLSVRQSSAECH